MEDVIGIAMLVVAALVLSIIALTKSAGFKASIDELKRRVLELERHGVTPAEPAPTKSAVPPPLPAYVTQPQVALAKVGAPVSSAVPATPHPSFNWESILGVKLFAWVGGLALFLGVVFFVKYAFENNWITPAMRIIAGAITGILLIIIS